MRWCWIDRIIELVPGERLTAVKHVVLGDEAVSSHFAADPELGLPETPVMPASLIIEGMAQTAGILVGHTGQFKEKVILAKISRAELERDATPGCTLRYTATLDRIDAAGASTTGVVELIDPGSAAAGAASNVIGRIDLLFSHIDKNFAGAQFPEHNFVFSDSFRTLLRMSGVEVNF